MSGGSQSSICCLPRIYKQGAFRVVGGLGWCDSLKLWGGDNPGVI